MVSFDPSAAEKYDEHNTSALGEEKRDWLVTVPILKGLVASGRIISRHADMLRSHVVPRGTVIVSKGDVDDSEMYFIRQGEARARSHCPFVTPRIHFIPDSLRYSLLLLLKRQCDRTLGEAEVTLSLGDPGFAALGPGKFFGEAALLTSEPRNAYIRAKNRMKLYVLTKADLEVGFGRIDALNCRPSTLY